MTEEERQARIAQNEREIAEIRAKIARNEALLAKMAAAERASGGSPRAP